MSKHFRIKLVTIDPSLLKWPTLAAKKAEILKALATVQNGTFEIDIEYRKDLKPVVNSKGKITHDWMDSVSGPYGKAVYDFVILHMSERQRTKFGIQPTLNGAAQNDTDLIGEAYLMSDELGRRGGYNKFVQVFLHEFRHMLKRGTRQYDDTHELHGTRGDIRRHFWEINMEEYDPVWYHLRGRVTFLQGLVAKLKRMIQAKTIYSVCLESLGTDVSPRDGAPDIVGCAETASEIIRKIDPTFPIILGTWTLWEELDRNSKFKKVVVPEPGVLLISPTGTSKNPKVAFPGHVGFFLDGKKIASNSSANGLFEQNYTLETWRDRWEKKGGYPIYCYKLIK